VAPGGAPYSSTRGMGGLMLIGHQSGGKVYAYDLAPDSDEFTFVGEFVTDRDETAGLEFDRSTGLLFLWHGAGHNVLEVARMSSMEGPSGHKLDTIRVYGTPPKVPFGSENHEGIAVVGNDDCVGGRRSFFLTTDGGGFYSLLRFVEFPCE